MNNKYDFMFKYLHNATKEERHIDEMEAFAKKHPLLFAKCHFFFRPIVIAVDNSKDFLEAKDNLDKICEKNVEAFSNVYNEVKEKFKGCFLYSFDV
ncbi:MAG TPA: hypothetical protein DG753_08790, partial [Clostridium sp.]|nr:hypothetical protein [Clostridium sp.]